MLSVIVPTYNERDNIRALLARTLAAFGKLEGPAELLVVDDDSPDGTAEEALAAAKDLGAADRVRVVVRTEDRGLARAVMAGFGEARGEVLAVMDADLSHPPELLPGLFAPIHHGEAELTVASRRVPGGGVENWPLRRRFASWFAGALARPLVPVRDTTSGYFMVKRECIEGVEFRPLGYKIGLEVFARAKCASVKEVPFTFTDRRAGASKLTGWVCLAYLVQLAGLYRACFPRLVGYVMFSLVGSLGMMVDAAIFSIAYWYAGLAALGAESGSFLAQTCSFLVAATFNFALNRAWTFRERGARARLGVFVLVCTGGYLLRTPVIWALVRVGAPELAALFAGIFLASFWNFLASRRWAFPEGGTAKTPRPSEAPRKAGLGDVGSLGVLAGPAAPGRAELRAHVAAVALVLGLGVFRLVYANLLGLASDEAYYWEWSRNLDWGYHDHPPMIAYVIAAGTRLAGVTALGVRLGVVLLWTGTLWLVYWLAAGYARRAGDSKASNEAPSRAGLWAAGVLAAAPMFAVGGIFATPDVPFIFFWTATVALTLRALRRPQVSTWLATGVVLGLGMLSKYPMVLLPVALLAALFASRTGRRALRTPGPYLAAGLGAAICVPLLVWQVKSGFASVLFQWRHGTGGGGASVAGSLKTFGEFVGGQFGAVTPILFVLIMWALGKGVVRLARRWRGREDVPQPDDATLPCLVFPAAAVLLVFGAASFVADSEVNWPAAAYPTLCVLLGVDLARWALSTRARKALAYSGLVLGAVLSAYVHVEAVCPIFPYKGAPFDKVPDRRPLARWAEEKIGSRGPEGRAAPVLASSYQLASVLAFHLPGHPRTDAPFERGSGAQYVAWRAGRALPGGTRAWYFTRTKNDFGMERLFEEYELVDKFSDRRLGVEIEHYRAFYGTVKEGYAEDVPQ